MKGPRTGTRVSDVSNAEINPELQTLKRIFGLAIEQDRIAAKPKIAMLEESAPLSGLSTRAIRRGAEAPAGRSQAGHHDGLLTGWRVHDEILPLEWGQVDFAPQERAPL